MHADEAEDAEREVLVDGEPEEVAGLRDLLVELVALLVRQETAHAHAEPAHEGLDARPNARRASARCRFKPRKPSRLAMREGALAIA